MWCSRSPCIAGGCCRGASTRPRRSRGPWPATRGLDYVPDALVRQTHTTSQGGKSARGRRLNVKKAFAVTPAGARRIKGRRILLVDDVLTTGATAEACARALLQAGARAVDLAVIARVRTVRELTM